MVVKQLSLPHIPGYKFGVGIDRLSGSVMNLAVAGDPETDENAQGITQSLTLSRINSTADLQSALGIDAEANYGCAAFGAGVSARFSFAQSAEVHSASLFLALSATVKQADMSILQCVLAPNAAEVVNNPDVFEARYGDMFCHAAVRGGVFVASLRLETYTSEEATELEASLKGSYGAFSGQASTSFKETVKNSNANLYCSVYTEGGPTIQLKDPHDPDALLEMVNKWLAAMSSDPSKYSVPYQWTMSSLAMAEGPLPPNAADLQHAQDVLAECARSRSRLLDQLNLIEWVRSHWDHYKPVAGGPSQQTFADAVAATQHDLDTVAAAASAAMNNPAAASMPADFARSRGDRYPTAEVPSPLPEGIPAEAAHPDDGKGGGDGIPFVQGPFIHAVKPRAGLLTSFKEARATGQL